MAKDFLFGSQARERILKGISTLNDAVKTTLGPKGRNVMFSRFNQQFITKDGVTVARQVELKDPFENMGAQIAKSVANKTVDAAGDGTTSATVLAHAIYSEGVRLLAANYSPTEIKRGIDWSVREVVNSIKRMAKEITSEEEIEQVATISTNGDKEIGKLVSDAMSAVGKDGFITLSEGGRDNELEIVNGYNFDRGWLSPYFSTNEKLESVLKDPVILVTDQVIDNQNVIMPILNEIYSEIHKPILIIAENVVGEALAIAVINHRNQKITSCAIKAPGFGDRKSEMLEDIAIFTGATLVSDKLGHKLEHFESEWFGSAEKVVVTKTSTTIVKGSGNVEDIEERVSVIRNSLEAESDEYDVEKQRERLAKLTGGVGVIHIGANSEIEMKEKMDRAEDALGAAQAAVQEGVVPGGGVALLRAAKELEVAELPEEEFEFGRKIILSALKAPIRQIAENAGQPPDVVTNKVLESSDPFFGYNAHTDKFEDLVESGVIDPAKVVRSAIENAASVAGTMLTTECVMIDLPEEKKNK